VEASAIGHALTLRRPLRMEHLRENVYEVDGTPTDCVNVAITKLYAGGMPDLVVSGINKGLNIGDDLTYSGTVSGALGAALLGAPSIRVAAVRETDRGVAGADDRHVRLRAVGLGGDADRRDCAARRPPAAHVSQPQRADRRDERLPADGAGQAQPRDDRRRALRSPRQGVLLDRRRGERLGAARSLRLPGGARRLHLGHAAAAGHDGLRGPGAARITFDLVTRGFRLQAEAPLPAVRPHPRRESRRSRSPRRRRRRPSARASAPAGPRARLPSARTVWSRR